MAKEEYLPDLTDEEIMKVQEHLTPMDFTMFLEQLEAFHSLQIEKTLTEIEVTDPRWYSLE